MSLPKEPRQKMINMMYLVLTALLALNVSAEILNAFKTVDRSLNIASAQAENQNIQAFRFFEDYSKLPEKRDQAAYYEQLAKKAKTLSDDVYNYLQSLKEELKKESGLKVVNGKEEYSEDNLDAASRLLVVDGENGKGKGKELFAKLKSYKEQLLQINDSMRADIETGLPIDLTLPPYSKSTPENARNNWSYLYFHMTPTIAAVTILSKFQNDVRNSEAKAVEYFLKKVGSLPNPPTDQSVIVLGSATKLYPGDELTITAGVGAFSKTALPSVSVDGASASVNDKGVAEYKLTAGSPGTYSKRVTVTYKDLKGVTQTETKVVDYTVGVASGLTVSTDATRVFYVGVDNPLTVAGAGGSTRLKVNVTGAGVSFKQSGGGSYLVNASLSGGNAEVIADDGKSKPQVIRIPIRDIPNPIAKLDDGSNEGLMSKPLPLGLFKSVTDFAPAEPDNFIFKNIKFRVVGYRIVCRGGDNFSMNEGSMYVQSGSLADARSLINKLTPGSTVIFTDIKVAGYGPTRTLKQVLTFAIR